MVHSENVVLSFMMHFRVEAVIKECETAVIWVTHDPEQPKRVGGRILELPFGTHSTVEAALLDFETDSQPNIASPTASIQAALLPSRPRSLEKIEEIS